LGLKRVLLVANKVRDGNDQAAVEEFAAKHDLEIIATVPYDERLLEAERAETAPLDFDADAPAIQAIGGIASSIGANGAGNGSRRE
jgi:CO dehydrogenase maturation factor